jgi:hypothetical protein
MEEEVEKEKEQEVELEEPGRVMDEEWMRNYTKDLILPRGRLPKDLLTGVIRVVDGKHYHLDQYLEKAFEGELTPLETNIYHAGNTDPSLLPKPFQTIDYSTSFGKAFFNALAKDPMWTKCRGTGGQPFNTHPLGYILFQRPGKGIRVYVPEGPFTPDDTDIESTVRTTIIAEAHHELAHLGTLNISSHCSPLLLAQDVQRRRKIRADVSGPSGEQAINNEASWSGACPTNPKETMAECGYRFHRIHHSVSGIYQYHGNYGQVFWFSFVFPLEEQVFRC